MERCEECGGRFDRPGLFGCQKAPHSKPTVAQRIAAAIERDIAGRSGRCGLGDEWSQIDGDTQDDIRDEWADLIETELRRT